MTEAEFYDPEGNLMVPLRCQLCGEQIGLRSPGPPPEDSWAVVRCYGCAATEEAETITYRAAPYCDEATDSGHSSSSGLDSR